MPERHTRFARLISFALASPNSLRSVHCVRKIRNFTFIEADQIKVKFLILRMK